MPVRSSALSAQVYSDVLELIDRDYRPGDRLPAESDLAQALGVSRNTLREAMAELVNNGVVERQWGNGTFVRDVSGPVSMSLSEITPMRRVLRAHGAEASMPYVSIEQKPVGAVGEILNLPAEEQAWHVDRLFAVDGRPAVFLRDVVPVRINLREIDPDPLKDMEQELLTLLLEQARARVVRLEGSVLAVPATAELADRFRVPVGHPLIRNQKAGLTDRSETVVASDHYYQTEVISVRTSSTVRI